MNPPLQDILIDGKTISVLRLDLLHPLYGGNKIFKLKYNILKAKEEACEKVLTFGGAHSNHIFSTAAFCKEQGMPCVGVIRGREEEIKNSSTLLNAVKFGMQLHFVSNEDYRRKESTEFIQDLNEKFGRLYLIPEGGNNNEGVKGCTEILKEELTVYDYVFCACGTAATFSGIKISSSSNQKIIGISVLKGENKLIDSANHWMELFGKDPIKEDDSLQTSSILNSYHLGGYAAFSQQLFDFKNDFEKEKQITLDHIYTAKLFFAMNDLINKKEILNNKRILVIHSGGHQGNSDFEKRYNLV